MHSVRLTHIFLFSLCISFGLSVVASTVFTPDLPVVTTPEEIQEKFGDDPSHEEYREQINCDPSSPFPQIVRLPYLQNSWQTVHTCDEYKSYDVSSAILFYYIQWVNAFGDDDQLVFHALNNLIIEWDPEKKVIRSAYSINGEFLEDVVIVGLAVSPEAIWCYFPSGSTISKSSLIHELVHISLWAQFNTPDADHEGPQYMGWTQEHSEFIVEVRSELQLSGL